MIKRLECSWAIVLFTATVGEAGVETFRSDEGRFTILFADKPSILQQDLPLPTGKLTMHLFTASFARQTGEMLVSYTDYPAQALATKSPDQILDDSVNGTVQGTKGTLTKSTKITQQEAPGREFSWKIPGPRGPMPGQARIFLVGPRLYQVLIIGTAENSLGLDVYEMIFKSFKFEPAPGAAPPATKPARPGAMAKTAPARPKAKTSPRGKLASKNRVPWITHTGVSFEGLWNVQMPKKPTHTTEPGLFGVQVRNVHQVSDGKLTYTLKIQTTPDKVLDEGTESVLEAARDKLAEEVGGEVVEESDAQIAGYEGHAYQLKVPGPKPLAVSARAAIVGKRTVVLSVMGTPSAVAGPSAERFLDSFQVGR